MSCWRPLFAGVVLLLAATSAGAGDRETQERAAKKACLLGDFGKGAEILADLYLDSNDPTYIFNQGRCLEQNGQNEAAILRFQEYLRKAVGLAPYDADALRKRIDDLQAAIDRRAKPALAEPVPVPSPAPNATAPPAQATPVLSTIPPSAAPVPTPESLGIAQSGSSPEPQASDAVYKRWWFWTSIGAVAAGCVVTAVVLSSKSAAQSPPCEKGVACAP